MLIVTTAISGSGRSEYLEGLREHASRHGKKIKIYHVGDMLFEHAHKTGLTLTPENILNSNPAVINAVRSAVFEAIMAELPKVLKKFDAVIINVHAMFFWKHVFQRTWDNYYIPQLKPDLFVTFISDAAKIAFSVAVSPDSYIIKLPHGTSLLRLISYSLSFTFIFMPKFSSA